MAGRLLALGVMGGGSVKDNDDVAAFFRRLPRALAPRQGAAVVVVDHVVKAAENPGRFVIGAQDKMAALKGAAFVCEVRAPLGRGLIGEVALRLAKDRAGYLRRRAGPSRQSDRTQSIAQFVLTPDGDKVGWQLTALDPSSVAERRAAEAPDDRNRRMVVEWLSVERLNDSRAQPPNSADGWRSNSAIRKNAGCDQSPL